MRRSLLLRLVVLPIAVSACATAPVRDDDLERIDTDMQREQFTWDTPGAFGVPALSRGRAAYSPGSDFDTPSNTFASIDVGAPGWEQAYSLAGRPITGRISRPIGIPGGGCGGTLRTDSWGGRELANVSHNVPHLGGGHYSLTRMGIR
jgi:hypothetical protein